MIPAGSACLIFFYGGNAVVKSEDIKDRLTGTDHDGCGSADKAVGTVLFH